MSVAIDTNILIDILVNDEENCDSSIKLLQNYSGSHKTIICPIVYVELLTFFISSNKEKLHLDEFLGESGILVEEFTIADFAEAATIWQKFLKNKDSRSVNCPSCGFNQNIRCKKCDKTIAWRNHMITDFLIGAHAQNHCDTLLTHDRGFYKYFNIKTAS